jgi:hypothetical protein
MCIKPLIIQTKYYQYNNETSRPNGNVVCCFCVNVSNYDISQYYESARESVYQTSNHSNEICRPKELNNIKYYKKVKTALSFYNIFYIGATAKQCKLEC